VEPLVGGGRRLGVAHRAQWPRDGGERELPAARQAQDLRRPGGHRRPARRDQPLRGRRSAHRGGNQPLLEGRGDPGLAGAHPVGLELDAGRSARGATGARRPRGPAPAPEHGEDLGRLRAQRPAHRLAEPGRPRGLSPQRQPRPPGGPQPPPRGYDVKYDNEPVPGFEKVDTTSTASLVVQLGRAARH
jgi:hypothetical protein